ncbi:helicase-related protein [Fontibacillus sp. BL9]|uniref:DEAD/DEAH box helicase n=1 Tax=Fontibacillus sp. BL9 TaxID=3389971 RepID=UPI00397C72B6
MRVCLYAIRQEEGWRGMISLDLRVDFWWWVMGKTQYEAREKNKVLPRDYLYEMEPGAAAKKIVLLSDSIPLGWAVSFKDGFLSSGDMDYWNPGDWMKYIVASLKHELECEQNPGSWMSGQDKPTLLWANGEPGKAVVSWLTAMDWEKLSLVAEAVEDALEGRSLLEAELQQLLAERLPELRPAWRSVVQLAHLQGRVQLTSGVAQTDARPGAARRAGRRARELRCRRCGSGVHRRTPCGSCGSSGCAYCEACLAMGRSRSCALLLRGSGAGTVPPAVGGTAGAPTGSLLDRWGLSPAQREAAGAALRFLAQPLPQAAPRSRAALASLLPSRLLRPWPARMTPVPSTGSVTGMAGGPFYAAVPADLLPSSDSRPQRFLLWAVTGAGKTEMIFPLLRYVLDRGGKVMVATPRRDVVLELAPRLAKVFPEEEITVLYGGSPQRWEGSRLFLSTTHQLMRFYHAFDLVIIDELDAFPYHNDPMLAFAAGASCKPEGRFIFLSATPPGNLQREARLGRLPHARVPARFHGHPLPVPSRIRMKPVESCLRRQSFAPALISSMEKSISRGAQIFVFVSRIRHIEPVLSLLRHRFPGLPIEGTSSQDKGRSDHVLDFRSANTRLLVTTTILERGVTVPKSDVYILDADSELFDEASLVQMAGRAGRSKDDPQGIIVFVSTEWTRSQRGAVRQIRRMNAIARKNGFLKENKEVVK